MPYHYLDRQMSNYRNPNPYRYNYRQMVRYVPRAVSTAYNMYRRAQPFYGVGRSVAAAGAAYVGYKKYNYSNNKTSENSYGSRTSMPQGKFYVGRKKYKKSKSNINRGLRKYIKKVAQSKVDNQATGTWRDINSAQISCEENQCNYSSYVLLDVDQIEDAIDQMKVIETSAGSATAVAMNPTTQDGLRTRIINAFVKFQIRNNGKTPCHLEVRWLFVKKRMTASDTPTSIFEDGLENKGITSGETTDIRFNVYDSDEYKRFFKVYKYKKYYLNPGDEIQVIQKRNRPYTYDPDHFDNHSASDSMPGLTQWLHFRIVGVVAHDDTTTTNVGTCDATLDLIRQYHIKFSSIAGQGFKYAVTGGNSLDTMAAGSKVNIPSTDEVGETL